MKKTFWFLFIFFLLLGILTACGSDNEANNESDELPMLEVDLEVQETAEVEENVEFLSTVTYGDETVTDADEVEYEVWEKNKKDESFRIEATNHDDGTYTAETSFDKDGIYHVQVHVTARDLHTMPQSEIIVGEGGDYPDEDENADNGHDEHEEHGAHDEDNE